MQRSSKRIHVERREQYAIFWLIRRSSRRRDVGWSRRNPQVLSGATCPCHGDGAVTPIEQAAQIEKGGINGPHGDTDFCRGHAEVWRQPSFYVN
jgi:hypothetical protein